VDVDLEQQIRPELTVRISPKLIASTKILALSSQELAQTIQNELMENPALEVEENTQCPTCGGPLEDGRCPTCAGQREANEQKSNDVSDWDADRYSDYVSTRGNSLDDDDYDPLSRVTSEESLGDTLLLSLDAQLPEEDFPIAEYLVGNLDDRGYLGVKVEDAAYALGVDEERVLKVLHLLQSLEPAGIGARDLRECLALQLKALADSGVRCAAAEAIVERNLLKPLAERRWQEVASALGKSVAEVRDGWKFIKERLNPHPANGFQSNASTVQARSFKPDVIIRKTQSGQFEVEVIESVRFDLRINGSYRSLCTNIDGLAEQLSPEDRAHIKEHVAKARFFIDCVRQRWETLRQITTCLVSYQHEFLEKGVRYLKPLTRSELADMVGLHESTISRATADKYVLLPNGRAVSFDDFFDASLGIKDTMRELIEGETEESPLSDQHIAEKLAERHFHIARRTVAKYRDALGILPSRYR
jgi:RNA polymerase sigma-54 factor